MLLFSKVKDLNEGSWEEQTLRISGWLKGLVHSTNKYSCQKLCFMSGAISSSNRLVFFPHNSSPPPPPSILGQPVLRPLNLHLCNLESQFHNKLTMLHVKIPI